MLYVSITIFGTESNTSLVHIIRGWPQDEKIMPSLKSGGSNASKNNQLSHLGSYDSMHFDAANGFANISGFCWFLLDFRPSFFDQKPRVCSSYATLGCIFDATRISDFWELLVYPCWNFTVLLGKGGFARVNKLLDLWSLILRWFQWFFWYVSKRSLALILMFPEWRSQWLNGRTSKKQSLRPFGNLLGSSQRDSNDQITWILSQFNGDNVVVTITQKITTSFPGLLKKHDSLLRESMVEPEKCKPWSWLLMHAAWKGRGYYMTMAELCYRNAPWRPPGMCRGNTGDLTCSWSSLAKITHPPWQLRNPGRTHYQHTPSLTTHYQI